MTPILVHLQPYDDAASARIDVRLGDAANAEAYGLGGVSWAPYITERPVSSLELMSPDLDGRVQAGRARMAFNPLAIPGIAKKKIKWKGARAKIYSASALAWPAVTEFDGLVIDDAIDTDGIVTLTMEVTTDFLEGPLLTVEYAGGGGATGEAAMRGVLKPAGFGTVENIEPVWFDTTRWIGCIDGYGNTTAITKLMEGLDDRGAAVANYASYTALAAAIDTGVVAPGRWATCVAEGLVGLGAPPAYPIGVNAIFGTNRIGAMMRRILELHRAVSPANIDTAAFAAMDAACPYDTTYWTKEQRDVKDLIEAMAGSINATPIVTFQNKVTITRGVTTAAVAELVRSGRQTPRVINARRITPQAPVYRLRARTGRPANVLTYDQVLYADTIEDRGLYSAIEVYRKGHLVWKIDKSSWLYINDTPTSGNAPPTFPTTSDAYWQMMTPPAIASDRSPTPPEELPEGTLWIAPDGHLYRFESRPWVGADGDEWIGADGEPWLGSGYVDAQDQLIVTTAEAAAAVTAAVARIASDGWLSAGEKTGLVHSHKAMIENHIALDAKATALGVAASERTVATAAVNALNAYLTSLNPAWNDTTTDTPANASTITSLWGTAAQAVAALQAAIQGLPGPAGTPGSDGVDGIDGTDGKLVEFVWKRAAAAPAAPTGNGIPATWSDDPPAGADPLWMSKAKQELDGTLVVGETWSTPIRHDGPKGDDGDTGAPGLTPINASASPPAHPIACTFNGTPKAAIPGFQIKVYQGSTDVSALATYGTIAASGISGAAVDVDGTVTVTGMTAESGYVEVPITYGGSNVTVRVDYTKVRDGNAAVSGSASVTALTNSGTYAASANFNVSLAAGQTFSVNANASYQATSGTYTPQAKLASVNVTDGGAEVDMAGSEVTGGTALVGEPETFSTSGSVTNSTGGTKVFNIRLLTRRASGAGNSTSVSGSVGGSA